MHDTDLDASPFDAARAVRRLRRVLTGQLATGPVSGTRAGTGLPGLAVLRALAPHLPLALGLTLCLVLWRQAATVDWAAVGNAFSAIPGWRWCAAALAAGLSFWAVAQYDVIAQRHLRSGIPDRRACAAGAAAIAVGQTTGFGPLVGAALRWRLMPELSQGQILRLTGFVTLCFLSAWAVLALGVALPVLMGQAALAWVLIPILGLSVMGLLLRVPRLRIFGQRLDLPSLLAFGKMLGLAALDLCLAGLALYMLLPPDLAPPLPVLLAGFTLALGAGMLGGTPGGVGPFELALITLLPASHGPELVAALVAFRMVYYAVPCVLGASYALLAPVPAAAVVPCTKAPAPQIPPRAEHAIAGQNDHRVVRSATRPDAVATALRTPQSLVLFLGASQGSLTDLLIPLQRAAARENRLPCLYKLNARDAARVRAQGWSVLGFAREAVIDTARFSLDGPEHRQLRRFLRKAHAAGLRFRQIADPDWEELTDLHCAWLDAHGPEHGLTMGQFCPLYLEDKPLFGAYYEGRLVAFTSWLKAPGVLSLDVMRHAENLPQGTMHGLIHAVITEAQRAGVPEVNLAALPNPGRLSDWADCAGLIRFKNSFSPKWRPLYVAAPSQAVMALCAVDIRGEILRPAPLSRSTGDLWRLDGLLDAPTRAAPSLTTSPKASPQRHTDALPPLQRTG